MKERSDILVINMQSVIVQKNDGNVFYWSVKSVALSTFYSISVLTIILYLISLWSIYCDSGVFID